MCILFLCVRACACVWLSVYVRVHVHARTTLSSNYKHTDSTQHGLLPAPGARFTVGLCQGKCVQLGIKPWKQLVRIEVSLTDRELLRCLKRTGNQDNSRRIKYFQNCTWRRAIEPPDNRITVATASWNLHEHHNKRERTKRIKRACLPANHSDSAWACF